MSAPSAALLEDLRRAGLAEVHTDALRRGLYATDASICQQMPTAVCLPRTRREVAAAVRVARDRKIPVLARGGGTSLAGQATSEGIVLDFTKHLNRILEINPAERWARVEPGVIRDHLNAALAPHGLMFAPETSTSNRAALGGMIANNSSGMMSIRYGRTSEHLLDLEVLLADGSEIHLGPGAEAPRSAREAQIRAPLEALAAENRALIEARWPRVPRRACGYALDELLPPAPHFARFLCGSEGTLAIVLEARVQLVPRPRALAMVAAHFGDLLECLRAVPAVVAHRPLSVELLDRRLLRMSRENPTTARLCGFAEGDPAAILLIECDGDSAEEARGRLAAVEEALRASGAATRFHRAADEAERQAMHSVRRLGLGVMSRMVGERKPVSFVEDACVPVEHLADHIAGLQEICDAEGVETIVYGHASVGVLHLKPILNLRDPADLARMDRIARRAVELTRRFGGCWSGEHGDGIVRGALSAEFWGEEIVALFRRVKRLFDPEGLLNPGKVFDTPRIDAHLRTGPGQRALWQAQHFRFRAEGGFAGAVEMCNGVGACRKIGEGTMCPSFMATRDEEHSTRGRANALRLAMTGQLGPGAMTGRGLFEVLDLCLECKACKSECPNNVDMAKMKSEVLAARHAEHGATARERAFAFAPRLARAVAGWPARVVNPLQRLAAPLVKRALDIAPQRSLPPFAAERFTTWFTRRPAPQGAPPPAAPSVAIFVDTYVECYEPAIGQWMVRVLERLGCRVELAHAGCCCRPLISKGFLARARREGERTLRRLDAFAKRGVPVVVLEPSCLTALADDLPDLIDDEALGRRVASVLRAPDQILLELIEAGPSPGIGVPRPTREEGDGGLRFPPGTPPFLLHGHCHQRASTGTAATMALVQRCGGVIEEIPSGCCGMAGSFGYEAEHFDLSQRIGEDRLMPAVRAAAPETVIVASGFSCRQQIADATGRRPVHFAEAFGRALLGQLSPRP